MLKSSFRDETLGKSPPGLFSELRLYGEGSPGWKRAYDECDRIYAANADKRKADEERLARERQEAEAKRTADRAAARSKPVNIERAYQRSSEFVGVVIRTNEPRRVNCALLNSAGDYLRVETTAVTPPVDEILIRSGGIPWDSVRCWY
jgi:hypothetical protein